VHIHDFSVMNRRRCESLKGFKHPITGWSLSEWLIAQLNSADDIDGMVAERLRGQDARIAALEAERERLREALEPFSAAYADALSHFIDRPVTFGVLGAIACRKITAQDFSNAHRFYSEMEAKP
jgi:hypothetical protein